MSAEEAIAFDWDEGGEVERAETVLGTLETLLGRLDAHIDLVTRQDESVPHVTELVMQGSLAVVDMLYAGREDTCVDAIGYYQVKGGTRSAAFVSSYLLAIVRHGRGSRFRASPPC